MRARALIFPTTHFIEIISYENYSIFQNDGFVLIRVTCDNMYWLVLDLLQLVIPDVTYLERCTRSFYNGCYSIGTPMDNTSKCHYFFVHVSVFDQCLSVCMAINLSVFMVSFSQSFSLHIHIENSDRNRQMNWQKGIYVYIYIERESEGEEVGERERKRDRKRKRGIRK